MSKRRRPPRVTPTPGRVLYVLPAIADEWPDDLKDAVALRNACATQGRCPDCGATGELRTDDDYPGLYRLTFRHEADCRALTDGEAA